jgi:Ser/Thr protein kinase RdoA (MazF antagonist)
MHNEMISETLKERLMAFGDAIVPILHDEGLVASSYRIDRRGHPVAICKIHHQPAAYAREIFFLSRLEGTVAVPTVLAAIDSDLALVLQYCSGHLLNPLQVSDAIAYQIGQALAQVHQQRVDLFGDPIDPPSLQRSVIPSIQHKFEEELAECYTVLTPDQLVACRELFAQQKARLSHVDGPCIVHRDFRPGNVLALDGSLSAIIDWASARFGFAEQDLATWESGEWPVSREAKNTFYQGYASIRPIPDLGNVLRLLQLVRAVGVCGFMAKRGIADSRGREPFQRNLQTLKAVLIGDRAEL